MVELVFCVYDSSIYKNDKYRWMDKQIKIPDTTIFVVVSGVIKII